MALPVTDQLITQMMTENVRTTPTTPMEGILDTGKFLDLCM